MIPVVGGPWNGPQRSGNDQRDIEELKPSNAQNF